jgi:hypothetical protein
MGLGLCHHYTAQGKTHLKQIIQHVRQQDENRKLYNMIFNHAQLLAGTQFPIIQFPKRHLPHLTEAFIIEIWKFLTRCNMNIMLTDVYIRDPLRVDDVNLMNAVMDIKSNDNAICRFNQVRLYLKVREYCQNFWKTRSAPTTIRKACYDGRSKVYHQESHGFNGNFCFGKDF